VINYVTLSNALNAPIVTLPKLINFQNPFTASLGSKFVRVIIEDRIAS